MTLDERKVEIAKEDRRAEMKRKYLALADAAEEIGDKEGADKLRPAAKRCE